MSRHTTIHLTKPTRSDRSERQLALELILYVLAGIALVYFVFGSDVFGRPVASAAGLLIAFFKTFAGLTLAFGSGFFIFAVCHVRLFQPKNICWPAGDIVVSVLALVLGQSQLELRSLFRPPRTLY
jgi:hypothetical protein